MGAGCSDVSEGEVNSGKTTKTSNTNYSNSTGYKKPNYDKSNEKNKSTNKSNPEDNFKDMEEWEGKCHFFLKINLIILTR